MDRLIRIEKTQENVVSKLENQEKILPVVTLQLVNLSVAEHNMWTLSRVSSSRAGNPDYRRQLMKKPGYKKKVKCIVSKRFGNGQ